MVVVRQELRMCVLSTVQTQINATQVQKRWVEWENANIGIRFTRICFSVRVQLYTCEELNKNNTLMTDGRFTISVCSVIVEMCSTGFLFYELKHLNMTQYVLSKNCLL